MSRNRGNGRPPPFAVWAPEGAKVSSASLHDVTSINGRMRSIQLAFADPALLIRSRFPASRDSEREEEEAFEGQSLDHFARLAPVTFPPKRSRSLKVMFGESVAPVPLRLSAILCGSLILTDIDMPESAVDIAWAFLPSEPFRLMQVDEPTLARLFSTVGWPDQRPPI